MTPEVMTVTTTSIFLTHALDYFSVVWVELVLATLAAATYFMFSSEWVQNRLKQAPIYVGEPSPGSWMHVLAKAPSTKKNSPASSSPRTNSTDSQASGSHPNSPQPSCGQGPPGSEDKDMNKKMFMPRMTSVHAPGMETCLVPRGCSTGWATPQTTQWF